MNDTTTVSEGRKEACKTYLEQTKLLVALASAFLLAPAGFIAALKERTIGHSEIQWFVVAEVLLVLSVLAGYVVLGSLAGSQDEGKFDVFRCSTRVASLLQLAFYLLGICTFIYLVLQIVK